MPSHNIGYVHRTKGIQSTDSNIAENYHQKQKQAIVSFTSEIQKELIQASLNAMDHVPIRIHGIATELTHVHILLSWNTQTQWKTIRTSLRSGLSRHLNNQLGQKTWFARKGSRKRVRDRTHFDYLKTKYLPKHAGLKWFENIS
ncbi:MAG: hypothetical protein JKX85_09840 [Phycisphaeraceae bacterium]|nr:hypothetical protein [Phycisphaeraceae bacterium]